MKMINSFKFPNWMKIKLGQHELILTLSLLLLLMFSGNHWFTRIPLAALSISGFIWRDLVYKPKFWFLAFCFVGSEIFLYWHSADNHKYLTAYWFLSLSILSAYPSEKRDRLLELHARFYLVACMAFAVIWKLVNSDFTDHSFFQFTLLTDDRFMYFTHYLTGMSISDLMENQKAAGRLISSNVGEISLNITDRVRMLSAFMTYFTLVIETLIPLSFFFFPKKLFSHLVLIFFILVTYPVASVIGFAWLLILFAITQCRNKELEPLRFVYSVLFVLTQTFRSDIGPMLKTIFQIQAQRVIWCLKGTGFQGTKLA